ncbi:hypothetical protein BjapCC829_21660 [Bradyrhizobium barranii]|uniref:HTH iclR-type domain-containing protein n=1 Tax=Bradyrhizobium barranii TaxID=2992140 RepID=A0ABY3QZJ0_9BRAD|nr:hypothetical protein [Bradyrhizobium japonicum]UFW91001.1 hypothetical protein BjapCC829_21660 [Bradyrhizobium japonicum]
MPAASIDKSDARYPLYKIAIEGALLLQRDHYGGAGITANVMGMFVGFCVFIGHAEGRPMNATKIAHYLDMPRTTVLRKLKELLAAKVIVQRGNFYLIAVGRQKPPASIDKVTALARKLLTDR